MKFPSLNLIIDKKHPNENLRYVYINDNDVVATNATALVIHDKIKLFGEEVAESIPNDVYISADDWKKFTKPFYDIASITDSHIIISRKNNTSEVIKFIKLNGKYPNYKAVMPNIEEYNFELDKIGLNPVFLSNLYKAMTTEFTNGIKLRFASPSRAIDISFNMNIESSLKRAILMPLIINN